jgi:hypothetical protein
LDSIPGTKREKRKGKETENMVNIHITSEQN